MVATWECAHRHANRPRRVRVERPDMTGRRQMRPAAKMTKSPDISRDGFVAESPMSSLIALFLD